MVIHRITPKKRCDRAIQKPANTSQIILSRKEITGMDPPLDRTDFPNGARVAIPILKHCIPQGMPMMVRQSTNPPQMYPRQASKPPKIIQITFPIRLMVSDLHSLKFETDHCL
jgi:hypothetical protein